MNSEEAYHLEKYRDLIYLPIWILLGVWLIIEIYTGEVLSISRVDIFALSTGVVTGITYFYCRSKCKWLSFYTLMSMEEEKYQYFELYLLNRCWKKVTSLPHIPIVTTVVVAIVYSSNLLNINLDKSAIANVWQIHAAVLGLIFVVISFLIGLLDKNEINKAINPGNKIAEKLSFVPLITWNSILNGLIGILYFNSTSVIKTEVTSNWQEVLVACSYAFLISSIVYLFRGIIEYVLKADLLNIFILQELQENMRASLTNELKQKLNHQLYQKITNETDVHVSMEFSPALPHGIHILAGNQGYLKDIDLHKYHKLLRNIQGTVEHHRDYVDRTTHQYKALFCRDLFFFSNIASLTEVIAILPEVNKNKNLTSLARGVFKIEEEKVENKLLQNLKDLTEQIIQYVSTSPAKAVGALDFYNVLTKEFLEILKGYKVQFTHENSKDTTSLDWRSIGVIVERLNDIYTEVLRSGRLDLAMQILYFIEKQVYLAIEYKNAFLTREFLRNIARLYYLGFKYLSPEDKEELYRSLERKMGSLIRYRLDLKGHNPLSVEEFEFQKGIYLEVQRLTTDILKLALEQQDQEGVEIFFKLLKKSSSTLETYQDIHNLENQQQLLEMNLVEPQPSEEEKYMKIEHLKRLITLNTMLKENLLLITFALGGWAVNLYRGQVVSRDFLISMLSIFQTPFNQDLNLLNKIFYKVKNHDTQDNLKIWTWSLYREKNSDGDGMARSLNTNWLTFFYVLTGIKITPRELVEGRSLESGEMHANPSPDLELTYKELLQIVSEMEANKEPWKGIIPTQTKTVEGIEQEVSLFDNKENFLELHRRGIEVRKKEESDYLKSTSIDEEKIKEFMEEFYQELEKMHSLKKILDKEGVSKTITMKADEKDKFGIITLDLKYPYIKKWYVSTIGHGEHFAHSIIKGENKRIIEELLGKARNKGSVPFDSRHIINNINTAIEEIKSQGGSANIIIVSSWEQLATLQAFGNFKPKNEENESYPYGYEGKYNNISVYFLRDGNLSKKILVADLKKIAKIKHHLTKSKKEYSISVRAIEEKDVDEWLLKDAPITYNQDGTKLTKEQLIEEVKERVILQILGKFDLIFEEETPENFIVYFQIEDRAR